MGAEPISGALIGFGVLAALYATAVATLFLTQRRILFRPHRSPPDLARAGIPGARAITVPTADGMFLLAWYLPPPHEDAPVVLCLHGNAGHIGHRAYRFHAFRLAGWGVMMLEYRGYGGNPGKPSEHGLLTDARAALATVRAMGFPLSRILLWGESLGSNLAVRLAIEHPVAAVLLEAPYTSITAIARRRFPFAPTRWLLRDHFDTAGAIGGVLAPVLVMHGAHDRIVPLAMGRAVYKGAPQPKELWIAPDAGHVDLIEAGAVLAAADFVNRTAYRGIGSVATAAPKNARGSEGWK